MHGKRMKEEIGDEKEDDCDGEQAQKSQRVPQNQLLFLLPFFGGKNRP
jgi:hypothetical protein